MGIEVREPVIDDRTSACNITNEAVSRAPRAC